jgi:hypothetical protein
MEPAPEEAKKLITFATKVSSITATVDEYVADVKANRFCTTDWGAVLSAAPVCLELLASCHVVSSTSVAFSTSLVAPEKGFVYLKGYVDCIFRILDQVNDG